jgi:hypothetical protein
LNGLNLKDIINGVAYGEVGIRIDTKETLDDLMKTVGKN